jgi:DNA-directed RNA polymerase subunit RPC12/RpoP
MWTAAQAAAVSVTLAQAAFGRLMKGRKKKDELPEHTEVVLSLEGLGPSDDPQLTLVVYDPHTKSRAQVKKDIERDLRNRRWVRPRIWRCVQCHKRVMPDWLEDGAGPRCPNCSSRKLRPEPATKW